MRLELDVSALQRSLHWHRSVTGKTWVDMAEECGTSPSAFKRIVLDGGKPSADLLLSVMAMLGHRVPEEWIKE